MPRHTYVTNCLPLYTNLREKRCIHYVGGLSLFGWLCLATSVAPLQLTVALRRPQYDRVQ